MGRGGDYRTVAKLVGGLQSWTNDQRKRGMGKPLEMAGDWSFRHSTAEWEKEK